MDSTVRLRTTKSSDWNWVVLPSLWGSYLFSLPSVGTKLSIFLSQSFPAWISYVTDSTDEYNLSMYKLKVTLNMFRHVVTDIFFIICEELLNHLLNWSSTSLTWVDSYAYPDGHVWHVPHMEGSYWAEDVQRHVGNLRSVLVAISLWQPRCYHVGIPNGLHLHNVNIVIHSWAALCVFLCILCVL